MVAVCLLWIGLLSLAFTELSGFKVAGGWMLAGALIFASVAWVLVMIREMGNATDMPDDFGAEGPLFPDQAEMDGAKESSSVFPRSGDRQSGEKWSTQLTTGRRGRTRKVRSTVTTPPAGSYHPEFFNPDI